MARTLVKKAVVKECTAGSAGRVAAAVETCLPPIVQWLCHGGLGSVPVLLQK